MQIKTTIIAMLLAFGSSVHADTQQPQSDEQVRASVTAEKYMISAANPIAVNEGLKILAAGGTAADAATAAGCEGRGGLANHQNCH